MRDDAGRAIFFADPSRYPADIGHESFDVHSMARSFWYFLHSVLEDEEVQKKGCVVVSDLTNIKPFHFDRKLAALQLHSVRSCIPLKIVKMHICHPPWFLQVVYPCMKLMMGERLRRKVKLHAEEYESILQTLEVKYGISRDKLPVEMGGGLTLDHIEWLEERKKLGL